MIQKMERGILPKRTSIYRKLAGALNVDMRELDPTIELDAPAPRERLRMTVEARDIAMWSDRIEATFNVNEDQALDIIETILRADDDRYQRDLRKLGV